MSLGLKLFAAVTAAATGQSEWLEHRQFTSEVSSHRCTPRAWPRWRTAGLKHGPSTGDISRRFWCDPEETQIMPVTSPLTHATQLLLRPPAYQVLNVGGNRCWVLNVGGNICWVLNVGGNICWFNRYSVPCKLTMDG